MIGMRPFQSTISIADAIARIHDAVSPVGRTERVALDEVHERVAAETIVAAQDVPAFDRSAMDGYAVRAAETAGASASRPVSLRLLDRLYAGDRSGIGVAPGTCVEIATGAPLPDQATAVVMVEDTRPSAAEPDTIEILTPASEGHHVLRRASDMRAGDDVLPRGTLLNASRVGALAALGRDTIEVYEKPLVAILPTGNELVNPGAPLPLGHVYEVNRFTLAALVQRHGGIARIHPPAADTLDDLRHAFDRALAADDASGNGHGGGSGGAGHGRDSRQVDILVLSGGSSVGERDLVLDILRERGQVLFHGIAVKPGKPTGLALVGRTLVLAMPGNPTSCLSNAYVLLVPMLRRMARLPVYHPAVRQLPLAAQVASPAGKHQFMPVRIDDDRAYPTFKGSGEITSLSRADGYIEIPADVDRVHKDTIVDVLLY